MRKIALLALSIGAMGLYACGGGSSDSADSGTVVFADANLSGADASIGTPDATLLTCNPATNIGCGPNEKCGVIVQQAMPFLTTTDCVADGAVALGGTCVFDGAVGDGATGISDCVGGTECNGGTCVKVCDTEATPSDCSGGDICQQYNGYYSGAGFGWCEPTCDPVGDDGAGNAQTGCAADEGCFVNIFSMGSICGAGFCDAENLCGQGDTCGFINACHPGKVCATLNEAQDALLCAKLCIPPARAVGLMESDLPLAESNVDNGQAPWHCGRANDGNGQPDDPLLYQRYVCIPLGGDDVIKYWGDLTAADGYPYGSTVGVCIDTESAQWAGNPYLTDPAAPAAGQNKWRPRTGSKGYLDALKMNPDYSKITKYLDARK